MLKGKRMQYFLSVSYTFPTETSYWPVTKGYSATRGGDSPRCCVDGWLGIPHPEIRNHSNPRAETYADLHVNCLVLLPDINQRWKVLTVFSRTTLYKTSWEFVQSSMSFTCRQGKGRLVVVMGRDFVSALRPWPVVLSPDESRLGLTPNLTTRDLCRSGRWERKWEFCLLVPEGLQEFFYMP
jgi:hypothetical protein